MLISVAASKSTLNVSQRFNQEKEIRILGGIFEYLAFTDFNSHPQKKLS